MAAAKTKEKKSKKTQETTVAETAEVPVEETTAKAAPKQVRVRGKKYVAARANVDKTKLYPIPQAVELLKKTQFSKKQSTVEAHLVLKEEGASADVTFPYSTGKTVTVAVATEELLKEIEKGNITFNMLVAKPDMMPKLAKYARILGPKGLMPNPKNGTVSPNPEKRKAELEGGKTTLRSEKKAPLMHVVLGKTTQSEQELVENVSALVRAFPAGVLLKCTLASTMGPGIKVDLASA